MYASIVVGTDGSETAGKAVDAAVEPARPAGATVEIVSAYEPVPAQRRRAEARQVPRVSHHAPCSVLIVRTGQAGGGAVAAAASTSPAP